MTADERLESTIRRSIGSDTIRVEITADESFEDAFDAIREHAKEVLE